MEDYQKYIYKFTKNMNVKYPSNHTMFCLLIIYSIYKHQWNATTNQKAQ